jgi:radical SAM-linked protein
LKLEWLKAVQGSLTPDCRHGECNLCGVCDLETIKPVTFKPETVAKVGPIPAGTSHNTQYQKLQVSYAKLGPAKYFGHLELIKIFTRALRRAQVALRFSEGFHPMPKVSFESALPVGIESRQEHFVVEVPLQVSPADIIERVNKQLPEGLTITNCNVFTQQTPVQTSKIGHYTVTLKEGTLSEAKLSDFLERATWPLRKTNQKGRVKTIDLKKAVANLRLSSPKAAQLTLRLSSGNHVRPTDVLGHVFGLSERAVKLATIVKEADDSA